MAVTTLATAKDTYLVGLDDEHIAKLQESSPYYEEYVIPEGTYEGIPETKDRGPWWPPSSPGTDVSEGRCVQHLLHHL